MSLLSGPIVSGPTPNLFGTSLSSLGGYMTTGGIALANGVFSSATNDLIGSVGGYINPLQILENKAVNVLGKVVGDRVASTIFSQLDLSTLLGGLSSSIKVLRNKSEAQRSFKWMILMPELSMGARVHNLPNWMVLSATPSFPNTDVEEYWIGSQPTYYGGAQASPNLNLTFYLDETQQSLNYVLGWKSALRNRDRTFNYPGQYKRPITLTLLSGQDDPLLQLTMTGCFPTVTSMGTLTYGSSDHMIVQQTFSVDDVNVTPSVSDSSILGSSMPSLSNMLTNPLGSLEKMATSAFSDAISNPSKTYDSMKTAVTNVSSRIASLF